MVKFSDYIWAMSIALDEANRAYNSNEVPVGACIINDTGQVIATAHNTKEKDHDPCGHAEINVIQKLASQLESWRLTDCHLVVTLEPCLMCASALYNARLKSVAFGAYDPKGGFLSLGYNIHRDKRLNHEFDVLGGINQFNCSRLLSLFFKQKRSGHRKP